MGKNVGLTYGEFKFPAEQGFTGSAGVHKVKGYMRGGHVKSKAHQKMPKNVKMKGGEVHAGEGGYYGKPGDKYPTLKSGPKGKQGGSMPRNVKKHGGSVHDKLKHEGAKMGYAYGGTVKKTSADFVMKSGKQDTMDHGVQPAQTGRNQAEVEAGGNKRLKAGYKKGGGVHQTAYKKGGTVKKDKKDKDASMEELKKKVAAFLGKTYGPKEIPLKGLLGLVRRKGLDSKAVEAKLRALKGSMSDFERKKMEEITARGGKGALKGKKKAAGGLAKYAHGGAARKPYTGYNKQPGGSGNEDARYMQPKK